MARRLFWSAIFATLCVPALAPPAFGSFHLMKIVEVFPGTSGSPNAQYVMLQMYSAGQNLVSGHFLRVYNATGGTVATFTFGANVGNGATQSTILIATAEAATLFGISKDLTMTAVLPLAGGAVCFDAIPADCVSWGNFTGDGSLLNTAGTPYESDYGLILGHAIRRDISGGTFPTLLEASDDTNNSAADFDCANTAMPKNNAGSSGSYTDGTPCPVCGNNVKEVGEVCDGTDAFACPGLCVSCNCTVAGVGALKVPATPIWGLVGFVGLVLLCGSVLVRRARSS
ncbi:MAG: hypothetical protein HYR72_07160 [Deltaproteobacteria bacterium]|nr:hypothetical protein [Deltaproteobacteria bacterium]MBI3387267.1 hypothetical protein [Deltaproteobacteria bacterium]